MTLKVTKLIGKKEVMNGIHGLYYTRKRIEERERSDSTDFLNSIDKEFDDTMTSNNGEDRSSIGIIKE